jgi:predicted  nucleic acid-binding Zn-ribbon protein
MENKKVVFSEEIIEFSKLIDKTFNKIAKDVGSIKTELSTINNYVNENKKTSKVTIKDLTDVNNRISNLNNNVVNFTNKINEVNKKLKRLSLLSESKQQVVKKNTEIDNLKMQLQAFNDRIKTIENKLKID